MLIIVPTRPNFFPSPNLSPLLKEADLGFSLSQLSNIDWPESSKSINWLLTYDVV